MIVVTRRRARRQRAVKLKAGETVAEAENRRHNPSSKTHPSPMANGSNAGSSQRSGRSPVEETGAIYVADHTVTLGAQR